jgi:hypothetical protein
MEIGSVEEAVEVGGVWKIAQVRAESKQEDWQVVVRRGRADKKKVAAEATEEEEKTEDNKAKETNAVGMDRKTLISLGRGEITVDSAAEESVCPEEWGEAYKTEVPEKWRKFTNASGGHMGHHGAKEVMFKTGAQKDNLMTLGF